MMLNYSSKQHAKMLLAIREHPPRPGETLQSIAQRLNPLKMNMVRKARPRAVGNPDRIVVDGVLSAAGFDSLVKIKQPLTRSGEMWIYPLASSTAATLDSKLTLVTTGDGEHVSSDTSLAPSPSQENEGVHMRYRQKNGSLVVLALVLSSAHDEMEKFLGEERMKDAKWLPGGKLDLSANRPGDQAPAEHEVAATHDWIVIKGEDGDGEAFALSQDEFADSFESLAQAEEREATAKPGATIRTMDDLDEARFDDEGGPPPILASSSSSSSSSPSSSQYPADGRGTTEKERYYSGALSISTTTGGSPQFDEQGKYSEEKTTARATSSMSSSSAAQASAQDNAT